MPHPLLDIRGERDERTLLIRVAGEIDLATASQLAAGVQQHLDDDFDLLELDLGAVAFIDSTGVRALLRLDADLRAEDRALRIVPSDPVRRIVALLGLQHHLLSPAHLVHG